MFWLEMSRDELHGGGDWAFSKCLWSPSRRKNNNKWPYWETLLRTNIDDVIFHLRGKGDNAKFVGYSLVSFGGYETIDKPPLPGEWEFAQSYYKVLLKKYTEFDESIKLNRIFKDKGQELRAYFEKNKLNNKARKLLFYVIQNNNLQCQNGAYLTELDEELLEILFDLNKVSYVGNNETFIIREVETSENLSNVKTRIGQKLFSDKVKANFNNTCCFPNCEVNDLRFLIGSHIERWADNPDLRGDISNGLCLCLIHDKAFENGIFSFDENYKVIINENKLTNKWIENIFLPYEGKIMKKSNIQISIHSLEKHWQRINIYIKK